MRSRLMPLAALLVAALAARTSLAEDEARHPHRTRYFYAPSAIMLEAGEGYFSQKELLFSSVGYGVTDHVSVLGGTVLPLLFTGYPVAVGGVKVGGEIAPSVHLAAGAEAFSLPIGGFTAAGFVFASATIGGPRANATATLGAPFVLVDSGPHAGRGITVLSAMVQANDHVAFMTENWFLYGGRDEVLMMDAFGMRLSSGRLATDLGLVWMSGSVVPVPWLGFDYAFGG